MSHRPLLTGSTLVTWSLGLLATLVAAGIARTETARVEHAQRLAALERTAERDTEWRRRVDDRLDRICAKLGVSPE